MLRQLWGKVIERKLQIDENLQISETLKPSSFCEFWSDLDEKNNSERRVSRRVH